MWGKVNTDEIVRNSGRMRSVLVAALLVLVMGMLLTGCGEDDAASASEPDAEPTATTATNAAGDSDASADETDDTPGEIEVEHAQGTTTVPLNPTTIAVFDYSTLDTLDQLGIEVAGVPQGNLPGFLSRYGESSYENIGTLFEPDYEKLNALDPDLIIVAGRSSAVYDELAKMAPTIDLSIDTTDVFGSLQDRTLSLASIFEKEQEAADRLEDIESAIENVQSMAEEHGGRGLIVMVSGGEVTAYGPGSRFGMIHDLLGVAAVEEDIEAATHGDAISFEFILEKNPDLLYVIDRDAAVEQSGEAAAQVLDNELVHDTNAWKNGAVTYLDAGTWYLANAGLNTFASMVAEIEGSLK